MELGRRSNLGSLVSAVLVGLLALASNHYARMDLRALDAMLTESFQSKEEPTAKPTPARPPNLASIRKQVVQLERELFPAFGRWKAHSLTVRSPHLTALTTQVGQILAALDANDQLRDKMAPKDQMALLRVLFMAAEVNPPQYNDAFIAWSTRLVALANTEIASQAAALQFFHENDLDHPESRQVLAGLRQFTADHPSAPLGISLHLNVADELVNKGHLELARQVVKQASSSYAGEKGDFRLMHWKLNHGMGASPNNSPRRSH